MQVLDDLSQNVHLLLERYEALQQENAHLKEDVEWIKSLINNEL